MSWPWNRGQRSLKVIESGTIRRIQQIVYGFLLVLFSNFVPKAHRFWDIRLCKYTVTLKPELGITEAWHVFPMAWHWRKVTHGRIIAVHLCCSYLALEHHQVLQLRETQQIPTHDGRDWSQRWGLLGNRRRLELQTIASKWRESAYIPSPNGKGNVDFSSAYPCNISKTLRYSTHFRWISHTMHWLALVTNILLLLQWRTFFDNVAARNIINFIKESHFL